MGFSKAYVLKGGFVEWTKAGFPTQAKDFRKESCVNCHQKTTPHIVQKWKQSAHSQKDNTVSCSVCHGIEHNSMQDINKAEPVGAKVCRTCHEQQFVHFSRGKHAQAWNLMQAWPGFHHLADQEGKSRECTYCHSVGFKSKSEIDTLRSKGHSTGATACDNCHTGHAYSGSQAGKPAACKPCHQGRHTPQMRAYAGSPHGRLFAARQEDTNHACTHPTTCQTCHFPNTMHTTQTAWGSLGLALPMPEDPKWAEARELIMQGLGLHGPQGEAGPQEKLLAEYRLMPLSTGRWSLRRSRMEDICIQCHGQELVQATFERADNTLRTADLQMAKALKILARMGREGMLGRPADADYMPTIGRYNPNSHPVEKAVYNLFHTLRTMAWQGAMHGKWKMAREGLDRMKDEIEKLKTMEAGE